MELENGRPEHARSKTESLTLSQAGSTASHRAGWTQETNSGEFTCFVRKRWSCPGFTHFPACCKSRRAASRDLVGGGQEDHAPSCGQESQVRVGVNSQTESSPRRNGLAAEQEGNTRTKRALARDQPRRGQANFSSKHLRSMRSRERGTGRGKRSKRSLRLPALTAGHRSKKRTLQGQNSAVCCADSAPGQILKIPENSGVDNRQKNWRN